MSLKFHSSRFRERKLVTARGEAKVWFEIRGNNVKLIQSWPNGSEIYRWVKCNEEKCFGEVVNDGKCFTHTDKRGRDLYCDKQNIISLRGNLVNEEILIYVFGSTKVKDTTVSRYISLVGAEVLAPLHFHRVTFEEQFDFNGAIISSPFSFQNCRFKKNINGSFVFFNAGPPSWTECDFDHGVRLSYAQAKSVSIGLERCNLKESLNAEGIVGTLLMDETTFNDSISLVNSTSTTISMRKVEVVGVVDLVDANLQDWRAQDAKFSTMFQVTPSDIKNCYLSRAVFNSRIRIELKTDQLNLDGALFAEGGTVILENANVSLARVSANRRLLITGVVSDTSFTSILSIQDADTSSLTFSNISLKECIFHGAHNLGSLSLESNTELYYSPGFFNVRRRCIADEIQWRAGRGKFTSKPWLQLIPKKEENSNQKLGMNRPSTPGQIAAVYRDLRRGLEARADQPGAADFYYGEMEMRRNDKDTPLVDRLILNLYWLTSGYGLRASRSFISLATIVISATVGLQKFGFSDGPVCWSTATLYTLKSVLPSFKNTGVTLTLTGECIEIVVRFTSPILLALFFLALRGRVKR